MNPARTHHKTISGNTLQPEYFQPWAVDVFPVIDALGGDNSARFVGGCVRNAILNEPIHDIDLATTHPPQSVMAKLEAANIKAIPTGLDHGTITAVIDHKAIEITTLRIDSKADGRHAVVEFSNSWEKDASRRDFTMNALYADKQGNIYDPLGLGIQDAVDRNIKFIGEANKRIEEDALRILRYFRFFASYALDAPDPSALEACAAAAHRVHDLSKERITQEILKIIMTPRVSEVLKLMQAHHIWGLLEGVEDNFTKFEACKSHQIQCHKPNLTARLASLGLPLCDLETALNLSNVQKRTLKKLRIATAQPMQTKHDIQKLLYHHGREIAMQAYMLEAKDLDNATLKTLNDWPIPKFPTTGKDLIQEGFTQGAQLGQELKKREQHWIDNGFQS